MADAVWALGWFTFSAKEKRVVCTSLALSMLSSNTVLVSTTHPDRRKGSALKPRFMSFSRVINN